MLVIFPLRPKRGFLYIQVVKGRKKGICDLQILKETKAMDKISVFLLND